MKKFFKYKKGFTLVEVLLTLIIIGVIAVLVIPSLIIKITNEGFVSRLNESYNQLSQAYLNIKRENGGTMKGVFNDDNSAWAHADSVTNSFCQNLKCIKVCSYTDPLGNCWHNANVWYGLNKSPQSWGGRSSAMISNGALIEFENNSNNCTNTTNTTFPVCGSVTIDVNGFKGPNTIGRDIFRFWITQSSLVPMGISGDTSSINTYKCDTSSRGDSCTQKILQESAITY